MLDALNFTFVSSGMTAVAKPSDVGTVTTVQSFLQANTGKPIDDGEGALALPPRTPAPALWFSALNPKRCNDCWAREAVVTMPRPSL